jgi:hypothetical protein
MGALTVEEHLAHAVPGRERRGRKTQCGRGSGAGGRIGRDEQHELHDGTCRKIEWSKRLYQFIHACND